jgi:hypothetical protein
VDGTAGEVDLLAPAVDERLRPELLGDDVFGVLVWSAIWRAFPFTANELS